jgi:hypothetical protein
MVAQTDDLHCFFSGISYRHVADVQKRPEGGDLLTVVRSMLCTVGAVKVLV